MPDQRQRTALLLGLAGFALLSAGDSVIKTIAGAWPGPATAALRFTLGALGLGAILWWREGATGFRAPRLWLQAARGAAAATATFCFFMAIFVMPLADATAIQFANPMLTALISAWLLGERTSRAALVATLIAFAGVLMVLKPNVAALGPLALLPLGAALGMAFLMTLNRMVAKDTGALAAQFWAAAFTAPLLILAAAASHASGAPSLVVAWPRWDVVARIAVVAVTASAAHALIYAATTRASSAAVAPTVYVQIIVALAAGLALFGDRPDALALAGTAVIIAAGLWLWRQGRPAG